MFGFVPKPPIRTEERAWVDRSMAWFVEVFGRERLEGSAPILPTPDFFLEWEPTDAWAQAVCDCACTYMRVDRTRLDLHLIDVYDFAETMERSMGSWESSRSGAAGLYIDCDDLDKIKIVITEKQLRDPMALVATVSHELGHVLLLADEKLDRDASDMEPLTDLITVFTGMGIFTANSAVRFSQHSHGWSCQRLGYLPETVFAYGLAWYAFQRGDRRPAWAKYLNVNVRSYFQQSLKCLEWEERKGGS